LAKEFSNNLPDYKIGMAKVQGHLLKYKHNPEGAVKNCK